MLSPNKSCGLCKGENFASGKDTFLCQINGYIIFQNGIPYIIEGDIVKKFEQRFTIYPQKHTASLNQQEIVKIKKTLIDYLIQEHQFGMDQFLLKTTGSTYPDHFHLHAFVFPFEIIPEQKDLSFLPHY